MSTEEKIPSRVSITYSVDFKEVPERVKILMTELAHAFNSISKLCRDAGNLAPDDGIEALKSMVDIKALVSKSGIRVDDCMEILIGYLGLLKQAQEEEPVEPEEAVPSPEEDEKPKKKKSKKKED